MRGVAVNGETGRQPGLWGGFGGCFPKARGGRKEQRDKEQASSAAPCSVTSARSAGSYGGVRGVPKWGQNRRGDITFAVVFPESLLLQEKSRGHAS